MARPSFERKSMRVTADISRHSAMRRANSSAWAGARRPMIGARRDAQQQHWSRKNLGATRQGFQNGVKPFQLQRLGRHEAPQFSARRHAKQLPSTARWQMAQQPLDMEESWERSGRAFQNR
ncbi:hypothetical protein HAX54_030145 [Datura stramonium]|uniref:Uncharacterized protein n=1 Tax=Datura stramonium TaxID=4076 RepID=A0ABS8V8M0_DATST|nr:hypothetical protein [Datura stramonium]